ncbi:uncharacterized protein LOC131943862 [Physella acuta]|uniref:uncharacterized protein LOC131943862 n=1 Tax=Physella acuta TaxID=109671 RepID=UPI0027DC0452|nr:uncharacterized protein LOC131943862 [Physella acuta]
MDTSKKTDLLLLGKTGSGKSSIGNSILGNKAFSTSGDTTSETKDAQFEVCLFEDRLIQVVDVPGTNDTEYNKTDAIKIVSNAITKAMIANPEGYHAFLFVVKYGARQTSEEQSVLDVLKGIIGRRFLKDFGIIVMSGGDDFLNDNEDKNLTFEKYCLKQEAYFKKLLTECNNRIVLFNNRIKDEAVRQKQVKDLVTMVDQLPCKEIDKLINEIKRKDKGTGALNKLLEHVQGDKKIVWHLIQYNQKSIQRIEEFKRKEEELKNKNNEDIKKIREQLARERDRATRCQVEENNRLKSDISNQIVLYTGIKQESERSYFAQMADFAVRLSIRLSDSIGCRGALAGAITGAIAGSLAAGPVGAVGGAAIGAAASCMAERIVSARHN